MFRLHWPKILIGVAALVLLLTVARCDQMAGPAAPLSPLTFLSTSPLPPPVSPLPTATVGWRIYLPLIVKNLDSDLRLPPGPPQAHLPIVVRGHPSPTPTPAPTSIPTPVWPSALSRPGRSKLGLHVIQNNSPK